MTLLLCPECCQWREPVEGRCPVCAGALDLVIPDPSLETIANEIGDLQGLLGEVDVSRDNLPKCGRLYATTNGLLFVPTESRVIVFENANRTRAVTHTGWFGRWIVRWWSRLSGRDPAARFACERRGSELTVSDRIALAELLRSDPAVLFWSRGAIASWRRQHGRWELLRPDEHWWPERISMRDRDGDCALQTWLETTACPLPVNVR
ncbi:MAG: hypothetical protein IAG10_21290 [Planctomycetaceae bacterium]|nr:hypothetical protein [Planctomycetaceae bacterium]